MYYQLPLERLARHRHAQSQASFAAEAMSLLPESDDARYEPAPRGLLMFGANESSLEMPAEILRDRYGDQVNVGSPRIRYLPGHPLQQPVMVVKATVRREHQMRLLLALRRRDARIQEECLRGRIFITRALAPLANLLGLRERLADLTDGTAQVAMQLSHYESIEQP